jgi:predicted permease
MGTWLRRLAYVLRRSRHETELREELEAHRTLRAEHLGREGVTAPDAADASRRALGNELLAREDARQVWLGSWDTWWQDARYGLRALRGHPTFVAAAVATMAFGIGVNTGIFSIVNGILFRDLPVPGAHELVSIAQTADGAEGMTVTGSGTFSTTEYLAYRDRTRTLSGLLALAGVRGETTLGGNAPQKVFGALVSCNYFDVLQQPPALGRPLAAHDCEPGADPVVVLDHELWERAFAADRGIVGRTIALNRQPFTVIGVAGENTYGGSFIRVGYFAPLGAGTLLVPRDTRYEDDRSLWLYLIGRRSGEAGLRQVRADLEIVAGQIDGEQPGRSTTLTVERARPIVPPGMRGAATGAAAVLMAAFACVLLIACANVANMLLARGMSRAREIGMRLALGASRARLVRQLLTESLLIAVAGGLLGSVLALWSFQALVALAVPALLPPDLPVSLAWDLRPDLRVLAFAVALMVATGLLFGLAPALHASRPDIQTAIKPDSGDRGNRRHGRRLPGTLVGSQVALCMVLMIAAGLLMRGLHATHTIDPGFTYHGVAYVPLESALSYGPEPPAVLRQRLLDEVAALPGVDAVAYADQEPLGDDSALIGVRLPGETEQDSRQAQLNAVTPAYFSVLDLPILRGRAFTDAEVDNRGADTAPRHHQRGHRPQPVAGRRPAGPHAALG